MLLHSPAMSSAVVGTGVDPVTKRFSGRIWPLSERMPNDGDGGTFWSESGIRALLRPRCTTDCYLSAITSVLDAEQAPTPGDALELVFASILKLNARANHEVLDRARDKDLVR
jgi:hypothetical protein